MRKAIIDDTTGKVINVISLPDDWTPEAGKWQPPEGHSVMGDEDADGVKAAPGDTLDGDSIVKKVVTPGPRKLAKATILDRMTDDELDAALTAMASISKRLQKRWEYAPDNMVNPDDADLAAFFEGVLGAARAAEVLA